ncbi:MAG: NAD-dependent epimerase/dehydratase family protein [Planctomycetes bacterium]|nr:NAD-dependent epimerase/dehydratase family protein [Planctomycetota bacterium]
MVPPICFVTGASGFVGRHLVPRLARTFRLRLLLKPGQTIADAADHERIDGHLFDLDALARGCAGAELVVHLAALVSFRREDRAAMFAVNAQATADLAAAASAAGVQRFLHCSTISAVAYRDTPTPVAEDAPFNFGPLRIGYCDSKFAAERAVLDQCRQGLDAVIVNPPSMYGAGDRRKGDGSLLGAVFAGKVRWAPPGGMNVANVADVCDGMLAAIARGRRGQRYLLVGENLTGSELLQRIAAIVGGHAPRRIVPRPVLALATHLVRAKERLFGSKAPLTSEVMALAGKFLFFDGGKAERELGWRAGRVDPGIAAAWRDAQSG